ncbi:LANO_0E09604g1_1 [Lachancea nothofagi CBS 11611]|uniref:LANO_0E09604g1_1 n=1 Tax=Lachancea nothofagi CBS 11611 TaxID=1266666 RepID=A0A1G4JVW6_9SACH|nr:LANO_0E09604g1_1 [Lachancea nothofagi CBS 11611]
MAHRASKNKSNNRPFVFGTPSKTKASSQRNANGSSTGIEQGKPHPSSAGHKRTPDHSSSGDEGSPSSSSDLTGSPTSPLEQQAFSLNQQRAIFEHRLITKNSAPQKNYSHVPCRFFRQGTCQAGESCPFSHSLNLLAADATPCKYFERGHCRFGTKCANAHILANGTRVNPVRQFNINREQNAVPIPMRDSSLLQSTRSKNGHQGQSPQAMSYTSPTAAMSSALRTPNLNSQGPFFSTFTPQQPNLASDSAIDEEEDLYQDIDGEDFIPGELSDLLTPKELERRNSRSSLTRKLSFTDHSSNVPSATTTLFGSTTEQLYGYEPLPSTANSYSGLSSTASTEYSPSASAATFGYAAPAFNYTYQQDQRQMKSMWGPSDAWPSSNANVNQLSLDLTRVKIHEEKEGKGNIRPVAVEDGRDMHQYYLGDLHQRV